VVVIVFDTLREDLLLEADTPTFDALAARGERAARAWSAGTWTLPGVASLFSGASLRDHGWNFPFPSRMEARTDSYPDLPDRPLLAEVLRGAGYRTAGLFSNRILGHDLGYERGFDEWLHTRDGDMPAQVAERVVGWSDGAPHFLYLHLRGCHEPLYLSRDERTRRGIDGPWFDEKGFSIAEARDRGAAGMAAYREAYRGVIEAQDRRLKKLLGALGPYAGDSLLVVTSDHGELLGEDGQMGHGDHVAEPLTRVPLIAVNAGDLPDFVSTAAVPALITRAVGIEQAWSISPSTPLPLVSQRGEKLALSPDGRLKGIWSPGEDPALAAFDLVEDPLETRPLEIPLDDLRARRALWEAATPHHPLQVVAGGMSEALMEALEALGYLGDDP
jgi:arylsulfatase A-like enzyme